MNRCKLMALALLAVGAAGLPRSSVAIATQLYTLDRSQLGEYVGTLPPARLRLVLDGIRRVFEPQR